MTCRRICRELVELFRFGELDIRSAPHLDHLVDCRQCRDEVGFDRELVQQLRRTLRARVEGAAPSADAWPAILARTQLPERGAAAWFRARSALVLGRLRIATAVSGTALAVLITAGTQVGIAQAPEDPSRFDPKSSAAGDLFERQPLSPSARSAAPRPSVVSIARAEPKDPEELMIGRYGVLTGGSAAARAAASVTELLELEDANDGPSIEFVLPAQQARPMDGPEPDEREPVRRFSPPVRTISEPL